MLSARLALLVVLVHSPMVYAADELQERAVPVIPGTLQQTVPLPVVVNGLMQRLGQLEAETRVVQALLNQPGSNAPAIVSARFPQLATLARQAAAEARVTAKQARADQQVSLAAKFDRIAADSDAITHGMEDARAKVQ